MENPAQFCVENNITNYPELTAQYFWLPDTAQGTLQKRTRTLPELTPPGYVRRVL